MKNNDTQENILKYVLEHGECTIRQILHALNISSTSVVHHYLKKLVKSGELRLFNRRYRPNLPWKSPKECIKEEVFRELQREMNRFTLKLVKILNDFEDRISS